jgi:radical SAM enzyme (TIGR01210 family)
MTTYPDTPAARDRWILGSRPPRNPLNPRLPYAFLAEREPGPSGEAVDVAAIFLTNRECPWRCLMCDLWRNTLEETVPAGAIVAQVRHALEGLPEIEPGRSHLKLYNAGSFFDPRAIPPAEYPEIARIASDFRRTIVECHPALVGGPCRDFLTMLGKPLEVALGLETANPEVLERLNKRMTLDQFRRAAGYLREHGIDARVFILVRPPWLSEAEGIDWAVRSLDFAFACGASTCSLIPTRAGNGAMEALIATGEFAPPSLAALETVLEYGLSLGAGRVFADLWDVEAFARCPSCSEARIGRLRAMNSTQSVPEPIACAQCITG